jgi:hypothetical protein
MMLGLRLALFLKYHFRYYYENLYITYEKRFITLGPGGNHQLGVIPQ